ncbi:unnamed protein product [Gordionus sp. m RMFG-2023]
MYMIYSLRLFRSLSRYSTATLFYSSSILPHIVPPFLGSRSYELIEKLDENNVKNHPIDYQIDKKKNIFFTKVHKTGSSNIQNLLMRYGLTHGYHFIFPDANSMYIDSKVLKQNSQANIKSPYMICHHLEDTSELKSIPIRQDKNLLWISIVRDPVKVYESNYNYYNAIFYSGLRMDEFMINPMKLWMQTFLFPSKTKKKENKGGKMFERILRNPMMYDFGFRFSLDDINNKSLKEDVTHFKSLQSLEKLYRSVTRAKTKEVIKQYDLILVAEFMEESVVLLKHLLNYYNKPETVIGFHKSKLKNNLNLKIDHFPSYDEWVFFPQNVRKPSEKFEFILPMKARKPYRNYQERAEQNEASKNGIQSYKNELGTDISEWNKGDVLLYGEAKHRLFDKIESFGILKMRREVEKLKLRTRQWMEICVENVFDRESYEDDNAKKVDNKNNKSVLGTNNDTVFYPPWSVQVWGYKLKNVYLNSNYEKRRYLVDILGLAEDKVNRYLVKDESFYHDMRERIRYYCQNLVKSEIAFTDYLKLI